MAAQQSDTNQHLVFAGDQLWLEADLSVVADKLRTLPPSELSSLVIFEVAGGREIDLDLSGSAADVAARYPQAGPAAESTAEPAVPGTKKRGRPKLGVVGREITLLPRHWGWLDTQRGGASAALRRLVDQARNELASEDAARQAQDRTNRLLTTLAGNQPGFEEAIRALYARDQTVFVEQIAGWSADLRKVAGDWAADVWP